MAFPDQAAVKLEYSVLKLELKDATIWSHLKNGTYYDSAHHDVVFGFAEMDMFAYKNAERSLKP
jgi:hypothetical protein